MGDKTAMSYFSNIDSIITLLNDLGSDVSQDDVVTYAINGLSDKYGCLAQIIAHKEPFPDLSIVRSMVSTEEMRIRNMCIHCHFEEFTRLGDFECFTEFAATELAVLEFTEFAELQVSPDSQFKASPD
ncbi:hypothetical protein Tco_0907620 [Tanacetum coccineum]|uniref:Uncharacterized protein n=1 Tax=Tanacetum coccineum TaxID=301880 RepID=A0ABQ5CJT9_9ASTR